MSYVQQVFSGGQLIRTLHYLNLLTTSPIRVQDYSDVSRATPCRWVDCSNPIEVIHKGKHYWKVMLNGKEKFVPAQMIRYISTIPPVIGLDMCETEVRTFKITGVDLSISPIN